MDLKKKLSDLKGMILGLRMEMGLIEHDLGRIEVDLFYLDKLQRDLIYNINLLRRDDIVSVMSEYKKSIEALKEVRNKIIKFRFLRQDLQETIDRKIKQCEYCYAQFEIEQDDSDRVLSFPKREK